MRNRLTSFFLAATVLGAGCGTPLAFIAPRRADGTPVFTGNRTPPPANTTSPAASDPQAYLNRLDAHLRGQGFVPAGNAVRNNAMPSTGLVAYALDAQPGLCYSAVAIGDSGTDLNMVLLDPYGRTESYDVQPDSTPHIEFCPRQAGRYVVRLQMGRGRGGYYYLAYQGQAGRESRLAAFFGGGASGGATATQAPQTAQLDGNTRNRYQEQDATLTRESFVRVSEPIGLMLSQREERLFPLNLSSSACYAFATLGGPGTSDTDVFVVDGSGAELASDARVDLDAVVRFCPPSDGTYQLRARLYGGSGPVFIAGWMQQRAAVATTNSGSGTTTTPVSTPPAPTTSVISSTSTAAGGIAEAYTLVDIDMHARGYVIQGEAQEGSLTSGESRDFDVTVESDKCYAVVALGDSGVRNLDVSLLDGTRVIDRENEASGRAIVRVCSSGAGRRTVRIASTDGGGAFKFALYQFTQGTRGPFGLAGLSWVRLREVTQLLEAESYSPSLDFSIETGRLAAQERVVSHRLELASGKCYAVVVVGGNGVSSIRIGLERGGTVVAENRTGSSFPDVRVCPDQAGRFDLRVASTAGTGQYAYQVFERAR